MTKLDPKRLLAARDSLSTLISRINDQKWTLVAFNDEWGYDTIDGEEPKEILAELEFIKDLLGEMITDAPKETTFTRAVVHDTKQ